MIRILTTNEPKATTFTIDGQLAGEYVDAVKASIQRALAGQLPVHIYLREVSHIDEQGRHLLSELAADGVQLSAAGVYTAYIVEEARRKNRPR